MRLSRRPPTALRRRAPRRGIPAASVSASSTSARIARSEREATAARRSRRRGRRCAAPRRAPRRQRNQRQRPDRRARSARSRGRPCGGHALASRSLTVPHRRPAQAAPARRATPRQAAPPTPARWRSTRLGSTAPARAEPARRVAAEHVDAGVQRRLAEALLKPIEHLRADRPLAVLGARRRPTRSGSYIASAAPSSSSRSGASSSGAEDGPLAQHVALASVDEDDRGLAPPLSTLPGRAGPSPCRPAAGCARSSARAPRRGQRAEATGVASPGRDGRLYDDLALQRRAARSPGPRKLGRRPRVPGRRQVGEVALVAVPLDQRRRVVEPFAQRPRPRDELAAPPRVVPGRADHDPVERLPVGIRVIPDHEARLAPRGSAAPRPGASRPPNRRGRAVQVASAILTLAQRRGSRPVSAR